MYSWFNPLRRAHIIRFFSELPVSPVPGGGKEAQLFVLRKLNEADSRLGARVIHTIFNFYLVYILYFSTIFCSYIMHYTTGSFILLNIQLYR